MSVLTKTVIVTGGNKGLGKAIADHFLTKEWNVSVWSRTASPTFSKTYLGCPCDIRSLEDVEAAYQKVKQHFKQPPSILINAAGINRDGLAVQFPQDSVDSIISTNVIGTMNVTKIFLRDLLRRPHSSSMSFIVTLGSIVGLTGNRGQSVYSASKSALMGWTLSLAKEHMNRDVRVHLICPGLVEDTEMAQKTLNELRAHRGHDIVSVTKDDVIRAIDYLIESPSSNGIILPVGTHFL